MFFAPAIPLPKSRWLRRPAIPPTPARWKPTQVLLVQKDGILALLKRQPELALRMLGSMSSHLRVLVGQIEDLTVKDVETRLANWLVKRCPNPQGRIASQNRTDDDQARAGGGTGHGRRNFLAHPSQISRAKTPHRERQNSHRAIAGKANRSASP